MKSYLIILPTRGNDAKTKKVAVTIAPNLARSFVVCSKQDWIDADDMDERNANWQMLKIIMEDYLSRVCVILFFKLLCECMY